MSSQQIMAVGVLLVALVGFITNRWRYDVVAAGALLAVTVLRLIPVEETLSGFGHPAVFTVAAILIISRALRNAGIVEGLARRMMPYTKNPTAHVAVLTGVVVLFSGFMNNVGALALMLPVAMATASLRDRPPSQLLMPLAFGSLLGGLVTLIGTPPNVIIAAYHAERTGEPFGLFDFAPVGLGLAGAGFLFLVVASRWLLPTDRTGAGDPQKLFHPGDYLIEVRVDPESRLCDKRLGAVMDDLGDEIGVVGFVREKQTEYSPAPRTIITTGDQLILRVDPSHIESLLKKYGLALVTAGNRAIAEITGDDLNLLEVVVGPTSSLVGRNALLMRRRSGRRLHLLAIARSSRAIRTRLRRQRLRPGDVCLVLADATDLSELLQDLGLLPLADRALDFHLTPRRKPGLAIGIFAAAIGVTAFGFLPAAISFLGAVVVYAVTGVLPLRDLYRDLDGPVLVLLACMIPVGHALEYTGTTTLIAQQLTHLGGGAHPALLLLVIMVVTMTLSDFVNNAATAVLMAPIAADLAESLGHSVDPYLMAVAVAASCAFLTPIGHQSNTLVMSPGGYRFGDYWKLGLPLEIIVVGLGVPMILYWWPV